MIADGDLAPGDLGDPARQHRGLQPGRELAFLVEEHGPLEGLGHDTGQRQRQVPVLRRVLFGLGGEQAERRDHTVLRDQRQEDGAAGGDPVEVRAQPRIAGQQFAARGQERGPPRQRGVRQRQRVVEPGRHHVRGGGARQARDGDDLETVVVHQPEDQRVGAEAPGAARPGQDPGHVRDRQGPGERRRGLLHHRGLPLPVLLERPQQHGVGHLRTGFPDEPGDPVRAAVRVPQDVALGVGPPGRAVAAVDAEVRAVRGCPVLDGLGDGRVQPVPLFGRYAGGEHRGLSVVLVRPQVEDVQRARVQFQRPAVQVPVEGARAVQG